MKFKDYLFEKQILEKLITGPFEEPMSGSEIGKRLGVSRAAISSTLKKGLPKYWKGFKELYPDADPWELFWIIVQSTGMDDDPNKLLKLFPQNIQKEVEKYAAHHRRVKR
jgi:hypothetical protein